MPALVSHLNDQPVQESANRQQAEAVSQRIHLDPTGWHHWDEEMAAFPILQTAVWQERQVHISYERSDRKLVDRSVNPLGLVAKGSTWYLVAAVDEEVRSYRISRVRHATIAETPCQHPVGFNLAAYWQRSMAEFQANLPRYAVLLRVAPDLLPRLRYAGHFARIEQISSPDLEGWIPVSICFDIEEEACAYVLGFGAQVEVVEPPELRDRVLQAAKETIAFYTQH